MVIKLSRHAKLRLKERKILKSIVKEALSTPGSIRHIEQDKYSCSYVTNTQKLIIIFIKKREYITIITLYYENHI